MNYKEFITIMKDLIFNRKSYSSKIDDYANEIARQALEERAVEEIEAQLRWLQKLAEQRIKK